MKKIITLLAALLMATSSFAQQGINYKAILKDTNGNVLSGTFMNVQFTIHQNSATGNIVYQEDHNYTTDANGLLILNIGTDASPIVGTFASIDWGADIHFLQTTITYSGGNINFDATQFMAVPYAKHAKIADNVSGLEALNDGNGLGWRLIGRDPANYGLVGNSAVDLSYSDSNATPYGAMGDYSTAMGYATTALGDISTAIGAGTTASGYESTAMGFGTTASGTNSTAMGQNTTASGYVSTAMGHGTTASGSRSTAMGYFTTASGAYSTAMGIVTTASGRFSTAMGYETTARSAYETAIGRYTTNETPLDSINWNANDRLFVIGNGTSSSLRKNAMVVLKNGKTGINTSTPASLFEVSHENGTPSSTNRTNALSIRNLSNGESWQLYSHSLGYLELYKDGTHKGSFNPTSGVYATASDKRVKKDITPLESGTLNKVLQLNPVSYLMIDQTDTNRNLGLISQEVQAIFPSITHYVKESDLLTLSYTELIPILIKALQEQQAIIDGQTIENIKQNSTIESLLQRMTALEATNN